MNNVLTRMNWLRLSGIYSKHDILSKGLQSIYIALQYLITVSQSGYLLTQGLFQRIPIEVVQELLFPELIKFVAIFIACGF